MRWYDTGKQTLALRRNTMRVDMHVHCGDEEDFNNANDLSSAIKSVLTAAIYKGLDVVGIVAHNGPNIGWQALQIAKNDHLDIWVIPGQEYVCSDKIHLLVYMIKQPLPPNLPFEQAVSAAHQNGGWVMAINLSKRQSQMINKLKGQPNAPDAVEIYNAVTGGYQDIDVEYPKFISSAAKSASDIDKANVFTLLSRDELEKYHLMPTDEGTDFVPGYLQKEDQQQGLAPAPAATPGG